MKSKLILTLFYLLLAMECHGMGREDIDWEKKDREHEEKMIKKRDPRAFYNVIYIEDVDSVRIFLEAGADPNKCRGENGWVDSNPLKVATESYYNTYYRNQRQETIPEPAPDVAVIRLLVDAGADVNKLPYVWDRVYRRGNGKYYERLISKYKLTSDPTEVKIEIETYVDDANRVLVALLEAGANPDKLGHPFPFGYDWKLPYFTDKKANEYFAQGTRAINEAIKKGILWESQVDLLLQYTKLDENSLIAAEESGDPAMIEKINKLWEIQQNSNP